MTGASNQQWLIAETSGIRNLVRQCRFGRFNGPSSGANSLVELAKPTPFSTFHTDLGHLILKLQNFVIVCFVLYWVSRGKPCPWGSPVTTFPASLLTRNVRLTIFSVGWCTGCRLNRRTSENIVYLLNYCVIKIF